MSTTATAVDPQTVAPMPFFRRLVGIFTAPRPVFENLRVHPAILGMLLLNLVCFLGSYVAIAPIITRVQIEKAQEAIDKNENIPAEKKEEIMDRQREMMGSPAMKVIIPVTGALFTVGMAFFWALIVMVGTNFMLGGQIRYKQALATALHVSPIMMLLGGLVKTPLIMATKNLYAPTSLALLLPEADPQSPLFVALNTVDIFVIWSLVVLTIGISAISGFTTAKSRAVTIMVFVVALLFSVGGAAIGKAMSGG